MSALELTAALARIRAACAHPGPRPAHPIGVPAQLERFAREVVPGVRENLAST